MARPDKAAAVAELSERFSQSAGIVLTDYRGLTVKALKDLRRSLGDDATYAVSKNTLTTIAAREAGVDGIEDYLVGPTAIAFIDGDPVVVAKGLRDFARTNPLLVIKGGVLDGKFMGPDEVRKLADLESREVLLAKVAGGMQGILQQAISLVAAPLSQAARLLGGTGAGCGGRTRRCWLPPRRLLSRPTRNWPPTRSAKNRPPSRPTRNWPPTRSAEEPAAEPTNEELAAVAVTEEPAAEAASAAPAAPPTAETAAEDTTPAPAAEDN